MKTLVAAALLLALASPAHARNPCDVEYDTLHDNYCLHNPSKCSDSRVDWKSVAARCGIPEEKPYLPRGLIKKKH